MAKVKEASEKNQSSVGRVIVGKVVSLKMNKTAVVETQRLKSHRLYGKSFKINKKIKARNEIADLSIGDMVEITETRPISKEVSFKVIGRAK